MLVAFAGLVALAAGTSGACGPRDGTIVAAASSLTDLASDLAREWQRRGGGAVQVQLGASSMLARQIHMGGRASLFLSADPRWAREVDALAQRPWLANTLVLVVPAPATTSVAASPTGPTTAAGDATSLLSRATSLALGARGVPVGDYAAAALAELGVELPPRTVFGAHARDVLAKVAEGAADIGIVYATDAPLDPRVRIAARLPAESHPPVRYIAALITEAGRPLFEALGEPWARELARRHGFEVLP